MSNLVNRFTSALQVWILVCSVSNSPISAQENRQSPVDGLTKQPASASFEPPIYVVRRTSTSLRIDGKLDEVAWFAAPAIGELRFPWYREGKKEQSVVKLLWDNQNLYVGHVCQDEFITARHTERDGPISQDDCFEIMLAPNIERPEFYFNIEWNAIGGYLDNHRPAGAKGPRVPWNAEGVRVMGSIVGTANNHVDHDGQWTGEVAIPLSNFAHIAKHPRPLEGETWHANFNRHGGERNVQYSQWSAGDTPQPSFHTPHRFGRIVFSMDECLF